jgi:hypothetical protein
MYVAHEFKPKFLFENFVSTLWILLATLHTYGFCCSIEAPFCTLLNVVLKPFHLFFEAFCHHNLNLLKRSIPFKCFTFFSNLNCFSKSYQSFLILWAMIHVVFRFDLHDMQMDATQFSCCHGVVIQFPNLIRSTYIWM